MEGKSKIILGGLFKRMEKYEKMYSELSKEINEKKIKMKIYQELKSQENLSIAKRQNDLEEKIKFLKDKEILLQKKYKNLKEFNEEIKNL